MIKKILALLVLLAISSQFAFADVFKADKPLNKFTTDYYMFKCNVSSADELPKRDFCDYKITDDELIKRLEIINWYNDFDTIMRFRMYNEIVWDETYTEERIKNLGSVGITIDVDKNKKVAYKTITRATTSFESWAFWLLRTEEATEKEMKSSILSNMSSHFKDYESILLGFKEYKAHIKRGIEDGTFPDTKLYDNVYLSNIDEVRDYIRERSDNYEIYGEADEFENIFYPNVKKYLEVKKVWASFYRDYSFWDDDSYKRQGYTEKETVKAKSGDYTNSYENKVDYEHDIQQEIGKNILNEDTNVQPKIEDKEVIKTKLEIYEEKWNKDIRKDYSAIKVIIDKYVYKLKKNKGYSDSKVNTTLKSLEKKVGPLIELYEEKYSSTKSTRNKAKYKKYIWILLVLEKILEDYNI